MCETKMNSTIKITKLPMDQEESYKLNAENEWIQQITDELKEKTFEHDPDGEEKWPTNVKIELDLTRKHNHIYRDHLLVNGHVKGGYQTHCIKCLEPIKRGFNHKFTACFIPQTFEKTPEYEDATHIYANDSEYELYFYSKGIIDIKELCHEHVFLTVDYFPLHAEDCKGLCHTCGINLNIETCNHK